MTMDKDMLNKHVLDTAIQILNDNQDAEDNGWHTSFNDAIDQAIKAVKAQAAALGVEVREPDIDTGQIYTEICKDRNWR